MPAWQSAGDFSSWLRHAREALVTECGTEVDCGGCTACCSSSYFIHIRPEETQILARIRKNLLVAAPGLPPGNVLLGYDKDGRCPMLVDGACSIFEYRPLTCRTYDCRVFTAAGITAGEDKPRINDQVLRWRFDYPATRDRDEHLAVRAAAQFIREHAASFPGGRVPEIPSQLAILAIKVYDTFLEMGKSAGAVCSAASNAKMAEAIVRASRMFDKRRTTKARR